MNYKEEQIEVFKTKTICVRKLPMSVCKILLGKSTIPKILKDVIQKDFYETPQNDLTLNIFVKKTGNEYVILNPVTTNLIVERLKLSLDSVVLVYQVIDQKDIRAISLAYDANYLVMQRNDVDSLKTLLHLVLRNPKSTNTENLEESLFFQQWLDEPNRKINWNTIFKFFDINPTMRKTLERLGKEMGISKPYKLKDPMVNKLVGSA